MSENNTPDSRLGERSRMIAVALRAGYDLNTFFDSHSSELGQPAGGWFANLGKFKQGHALDTAISIPVGQTPSAELGKLAAFFQQHGESGPGLVIIVRQGRDPRAAA